MLAPTESVLATQPSGARLAPVPAASWLSLFLLTLTYAVYTLDKFIVAIIIEPLKHEFHLNDAQVGLFTGIAGTLPALLTCIPIGILADRVSRKWLLVVMVVLWSACTGIGGFATSMLFLVVARVAVTALEAGFTPISLSIMTDKFPPHRRSSAMGVFNVGAQMGLFFGLAIGGMVVAAHGWRWAFFLAGVPGLVMGVVLAMIERDPERGAFDTAEQRAMRSNRSGVVEAIKAIWHAPIVLYCGLGLLSCAALPASVAIWMPSFLIRVHHLTVREAGFAAAIIGLIGACGAAAGGVAADLMGRHEDWKKLYAAIFGSIGAVVAGIAGFLFAPNVVAAVMLLALMIFAHAAYSGVGYAFVLGNVGPYLRGTVIAIILLASNVIAAGLGNLQVGFISDAVAPLAGANSITYGMASILIFTALGALSFWRAQVLVRRRDGARAAGSAAIAGVGPTV